VLPSALHVSEMTHGRPVLFFTAGMISSCTLLFSRSQILMDTSVAAQSQ
jgi:hypothetical protein